MSDETAAVSNEIENLDIADAFLPDEIVSEEAQVSEDVLVSPFGFGVYPEIPADFPFNVKWTDTTEHIDLELSARVMIKAWNEGERFLGVVWRKWQSISALSEDSLCPRKKTYRLGWFSRWFFPFNYW